MKTSNELEMTRQDNKSRTETGQSRTENISRLPKTHQDYWLARLRKRNYQWHGKTVEIPTWQVRLTHLGREEWFNLDTPNKSAAAVKARDIYLQLVAKGWEETRAKFKPGMEIARNGCTVGEFLAQVKAVSGLKPVTFEIYAKKFRTLSAGVFNLHGNESKFDYVHGGYQKWLERVHRVRLDRLTPQRVQKWKVRYLQATKDPSANKRAHTTVNSMIRAGKALFAPKILKYLTVRLPKPLPFEGVENVKLPRSRYKSEINPKLLLSQATQEVGKPDPKTGQVPLDTDEFKILLLALGAGLRRDEIDTLSWNQMNWFSNTIRVETTIHTAAKSDDSENEVDVDPGLMEIFKGHMAKSQSQFVIDSGVAAKPNTTTYHHYRCARHFNRVVTWLRSKGITSRTPLHTLRKEFGSQIAAQGGIYAASLALRHSSIQLTRDYYLDKKVPTVFKVAELLA